MKDLRIVIPAYNEETGITDVIDRIKKSCPDSEIVVVDDFSKDDTAILAKKSGAKVISNLKNLGYGGSLKNGFSFSNKNGLISYIAFLDADGTYPPEKIPELYDYCKNNNCNIVSGSRLMNNSKDMPLIRKMGNKMFASLASFYTGTKITDTATGLRVFQSQLIPWMMKLPDGLNFTPAMTIKALFERFTYSEIAIQYSKRQGKSKLSSIKDGYRFLKVIMDTTREYRPIQFYCTLGIPFILLKKAIDISNSIRQIS